MCIPCTIVYLNFAIEYKNKDRYDFVVNCTSEKHMYFWSDRSTNLTHLLLIMHEAGYVYSRSVSSLKPASHWPVIKESGGPQSVVRSDEICSDYFPPIILIPLPDRRTKSHVGNRKLPPIVGPKSDMADYRWLPLIIIFPHRKFSHCPIFHLIFLPTLRSSDQSGNYHFKSLPILKFHICPFHYFVKSS